MNKWNGFRKIAAPVSPPLPESFPRKKEFDDRYDKEQEEHRSNLVGIFRKYFPEVPPEAKLTGEFLTGLLAEAPALTKRNFGNEIARYNIRRDSMNQAFDFDLTRAQNQWVHKIEKDQSRPTPEQLAEHRRQYQRRREQSPAGKLNRAIVNAQQYDLAVASLSFPYFRSK